jgi:predicted MFS family arabinose efflux permease
VPRPAVGRPSRGVSEVIVAEAEVADHPRLQRAANVGSIGSPGSARRSNLLTHRNSMLKHSSTGSRSLVELLSVTLVLLVLPLGLLSLFALEGYERYLGPELRQKADTVGRAVVRRVERALELGIPLDQLVGVDEYLASILRESDNLGFIALLDAEGHVLHVAGVGPAQARQVLASGPGSPTDEGALFGALRRQAAAVVDRILAEPDRPEQDDIRGEYLTSAHPLMLDHVMVGELVVGVPLSFLRQLLEEITFDTGIVLLVGLLVAFELLLLVISTNLAFPLGLVRHLMTDIREGRGVRVVAVPVRNEVGRLLAELNRAVRLIGGKPPESDAGSEAAAEEERRSNLVVVRILAFLFVVAEELARPFLPVYVDGFIHAPGFAEKPILIGLPLSLFMLAAAASMGLLGPLLDRLERRHTFLIGSLLATAGLAGTGLAQSYYDIVLWRVVAGIGYGLNFVACQGYVFDRTTRSGRAQGISMFVGGIMTADICGPAIGGIMADRIGFSWTFLLGAMIALIAGALVYRLMEPPRARLLQARRISLSAGLGAIAANWRFWCLLLLAAVPAKVVLTGFLFYQAPLYLTALGSSQSEIGRIIMTYGIAALALTSLFGYWADRMQAHGLLVVAGNILSGLGMLPSLFGESPGRVLLAVVALGVGQAMAIPALFVVVTRVARREIEAVGQASVLGIFRLVERLGAAAGPFAVAALLQVASQATAMAIAGIFAVLTAVIFGTVFLSVGYERDTGLAAAE